MLSVFLACSPRGVDEGRTEETPSMTVLEADAPTEVKTVPIETVPFHQELMANGKLSAIHSADLKFRSDSIIEQVHVAEGSQTQTGQLIASLRAESNPAMVESQIEQNEMQFEQEIAFHTARWNLHWQQLAVPSEKREIAERNYSLEVERFLSGYHHHHQ